MATLGTDLADIKQRLKAAESAVYANTGPSPVLVEIREAMTIVDKWLDGHDSEFGRVQIKPA